ncbi:hypothetical protein JCM8547_002411 [Rhodosporidiobolus lusitaniae]
MRFIVSLFPFLAVAAFVGAAPVETTPATTTTRPARTPFKDRTLTSTTTTTTIATTSTLPARTPFKDRTLTTASTTTTSTRPARTPFQDLTLTSSSSAPSPTSTAPTALYNSTFTYAKTINYDADQFLTGPITYWDMAHEACRDPTRELSEIYAAHGGLQSLCGQTLLARSYDPSNSNTFTYNASTSTFDVSPAPPKSFSKLMIVPEHLGRVVWEEELLEGLGTGVEAAREL